MARARQPSQMTVALIVAAGSGERLGADRPKALVELAGQTLLEHSIEALRAAVGVERIIVALPPGLHVFGLPEGVEGVEGGAARSESVRRALAAAGEEHELVLVHDAARPLLTTALAERVIAALLADPRADAAIAAAPVTDTIKRAARDGTVLETLSRSELWSIQTPQVFRREALARALAVGAEKLALATDDASLIERAGGRVIVVPADPSNLKVTTPVDLRLAELLLAERRGQAG
jgi:2-C-methyl-D-erythritol 4-phosphate cytidylyltransferase